MGKNLVGISSLVVACTLLFGSTATAVTRNQPAAPQPDARNGAASDNGLRVSPVRSDISIEAGKSQTITLSVTNVTNGISSYDVIINDFFAGDDETGQPQILLDADKFAPTHSLKRLVGNAPRLTLQPRETKNILIPVSVPAGYKAGGYYGAVRMVPHTDAGAAGRNVTLSASVGSLVLLTVPGKINEQMSVASLDVRKQVPDGQVATPRVIFTNGKSLDAVIRFQNGGDVQEQPFGKLQLKNWRGKTLSTYEVNNTTPRGNVLPDSIRRFNVPLTNVGSFGKYTLSGNFGYGNTGQLITASSTFYVIPLALIIAFVVLVLLILFLIFGLPRLIKRYNRRVVAKSRRR